MASIFKSIVWGLLALIVIFVIVAPKNDVASTQQVKTPSEQSATANEPPVNFTSPLYTKGSALVCPRSVLFDPREGHGLQVAVDAHLSAFGHDNAVAESGCQEWRDGIPVSLTDEGRQSAVKFESQQRCGMVDFDGGLIFSCDLRNANSSEENGKAAETVAGISPTATRTSSPEMIPSFPQGQIAAAEDLAGKCQIPADSITREQWDAICKQRDEAYAELRKQGWCYGHDGQVNSDRQWERCRN